MAYLLKVKHSERYLGNPQVYASSPCHAETMPMPRLSRYVKVRWVVPAQDSLLAYVRTNRHIMEIVLELFVMAENLSVSKQCLGRVVTVSLQ